MMTSPLDEKALDTALGARPFEGSKVTIRQVLEQGSAGQETAARLISAYLSATPAPDGMERFAVNFPMMRLEHDPDGPLVRADQAQSALAAMRAELERLTKIAQSDEWGAGYFALLAQQTAAEAQVKRLTEDNEALRKELDQSKFIVMAQPIDHAWKMNLARELSAAEARIKALEEAINGLNVTDEELVRIHNSCTGGEGDVKISSRMLLMLVANIIAARATINSREKAE